SLAEAGNGSVAAEAANTAAPSVMSFGCRFIRGFSVLLGWTGGALACESVCYPSLSSSASPENWASTQVSDRLLARYAGEQQGPAAAGPAPTYRQSESPERTTSPEDGSRMRMSLRSSSKSNNRSREPAIASKEPPPIRPRSQLSSMKRRIALWSATP